MRTLVLYERVMHDFRIYLIDGGNFLRKHPGSELYAVFLNQLLSNLCRHPVGIAKAALDTVSVSFHAQVQPHGSTPSFTP